MRFFLIFASLLFLWGWFTPVGDCAPIRQETVQQDTPPVMQELLPSSVSAVKESNQATLHPSSGRSFSAFPFPLFFMDQSGNPQIIIYVDSFQALEKELFREVRKNTNLPYSLQKIEAVGQVEGPIAQIRFELMFSTFNDPLISVPVGLREGVCLPPASPEDSGLEYVGDGSCELTVDPESGDYLLLVQNPQYTNSDKEEVLNRLHQVAFTLSFPVESIGPEERRMKISAPQAVSSRLVLSVPTDDAVVTDTQGAAILRSIKPLPDGGTQFELRGFSKLPDLSWYRQIQSPQQEKQVALQVENARILVRMTQREADFDATLRVRAIGGPLQHFQVRLPPNTRYLAETEVPEYKISEITSSDSPDLPILQIDVTGSSAQETALSVRIRAIRTFTEEEQSSWCELGGFEVLNAERQYGQVEIHVSNDLQLQWQNLHGIRIDKNIDSTSTLDTFVQEEKQVHFSYHTQPFLLEARVTLPQTRISVKPEYQVLLEKGQIILKGQIQTVISSSKTNQLQWNFHDWQLEEIGPGSLVDFYEFIQKNEDKNQNSGITIIPLRSPSEGPVELSFTLRRPMPMGLDNQATVDFSFPIPIADRIEPAVIAIVAADNLELLSTTQKTTGMLRESRSTPRKITSPSRQQTPLIFRSERPGDPMAFYSEVVFHQQEVQAHSKTVFQILEPKDQIEQVIRYNVKYEPLDQITLLIPRSIHESESLKLSFDGRVIPESGRFSFPDIVAGTNLVRRRITLPAPLIGSGTLLLQYSVPQENIPPEMTVRVDVPQILPTEAEIVEQTIVVAAPDGVNIALSEGNVSAGFEKRIPFNFSLDSGEILPKEINGQATPWKKQEKNGEASGFQETVFHATTWEPSLSLSVRLDHRDILGTTVVERAWIQTWLVADPIRVDRASFRIQSDREKIPLFLPVGFDRSRVYAAWDGTPVPIQYEEGALVIVQPKEQRSRSHLLVVEYQIPQETFSSVRGKIDLPYFDDDVWVQRTYWQVILPRNRHLFGDLSGWTPEFRWNWTGLYWNRDASLSQEELELWIGSSAKEDLNDSSEITHYLFSSFNPRRQSELLIINRDRLILFSSGTILLIGFALIYFPRLRQASVVFTLVVLLVSIFLYQPTPALLAFQASILGVVLSLVSAVLARILYRESDWKYVPSFVSSDTVPPTRGTTPSSSSALQEVLVESTLHTSSIHEGGNLTQTDMTNYEL